MNTSKSAAFTMFTLLIVGTLLFLAACGSSSSSTGSTTTPAATASTPNNNTPDTSGYGAGKYGGGGTTPTASSATGHIKTATATVNGKSETILTNEQGMTLYYRTSDAPPTTVCSGGCAGLWPPLVVTGSNTPASSTSLSGKLSVQTTANGKQVEYNEHPLYTYAGDSAPGQTNGEGIGGVWHVVTSDLR